MLQGAPHPPDPSQRQPRTPPRQPGRRPSFKSNHVVARRLPPHPRRSRLVPSRGRPVRDGGMATAAMMSQSLSAPSPVWAELAQPGGSLTGLPGASRAKASSAGPAPTSDTAGERPMAPQSRPSMPRDNAPGPEPRAPWAVEPMAGSPPPRSRPQTGLRDETRRSRRRRRERGPPRADGQPSTRL